MTAPVYVRNAKETPKRGDAFKVGHHTITVEKKDGCVIRYRTTADHTNGAHHMNIETFRAFVAKATILEEGK